MSATLSEQVESLKQQTDLLRASAGKLVGQDLTNYNIGNIASAIDGVTPAPEEEEGYVRPSWYPNVEEILNNAPVIVKDGKTYTPCVGALYLANGVTTAFYKVGNTSNKTAVNYYNSTGCDAYIFSDVVENDISNANETTLEVGTEINHKWNETLNITNPDPSDKTGDAVRWAIGYSINLSILTYVYRSIGLIELFIANANIDGRSCTGATGGSEDCYNSLRYVKIASSCSMGELYNVSSNGFLSGSFYLEEVQIDCAFNTSYGGSNYGRILSFLPNLKKAIFNGESVTGVLPSSFLNNCSRLSFIKLPSGITSIGDNFLYGSAISSFIMPETVSVVRGTFLGSCTKLRSVSINSSVLELNNAGSGWAVEHISFPDQIISLTGINLPKELKSIHLPLNLKTLSFSSNRDAYNLNYIKIPSSVESLSAGGGGLSLVKYIELWENFDISGFSVQYASYKPVPKTIQWLKDLCGWLKDRTGETANTMVLGTANLANANKIFLTFDPNNKRNITWVDEGTEGAISITDFITNQLNWTLS